MLQVFAVEQNVTFEYLGTNYLIAVTNLLVTDKVGDQVEARRAQLVPSTAFVFEVPPNSGLKLAGQHSNVAPQLFKHKEFNFEKLGIGGLDNQFEQIFRRAFASRVFPPSVVERLGIHHVKGVLLFGPPGTGVVGFTSAGTLLQMAELCYIDFSMDKSTSVLQYRQHRFKLYLATVAALVLMHVSGAYASRASHLCMKHLAGTLCEACVACCVCCSLDTAELSKQECMF